MSVHRRPSSLLLLAAFALAAGLLASPAWVRAGDDEEKKAGKDEKPHLEYRKTYEVATIEARIRNLPIFVSRQKDF